MFLSRNKNLPSHSYIDYDSDGGITSINLGINEIVHKFNDFSIGGGTYELNVNHIYSSILHSDSTKMGKNWKLNIEQYIYPYNTSY